MFKTCYPEGLPICSKRAEIIHAIQHNQVLLVAGETGSGKTTQLPKMCIDSGLHLSGRIGCTQPRRVAAMSISRRVAEELNVTWGKEVGCKMRFNDDTSSETRIKFMTEGILLSEIQSDPLLRSYSALILDEAHERSLNIDFLFGHLQALLRKRPELKVLITSATIDTQSISQAFGNAPVIEVSGRLFPVDIRHCPPESLLTDTDSSDSPDHVTAAVAAAENAILESHSGDILIFMPTEREIRETVDLLEDRLGKRIEVLSLFGRMAASEQQRVFSPGPRRRVIVSSNIAETSLTLPRIRYVIDSGLARISRYNPRTRTKRLPVEEIAQSSANQRAGRAGRLQDGICIRLYSAENFEKRPRFHQPEIQRANLAEVILRMKAFRLGEIESFPFLNPPQQAAIRSGYRLLHELGALNETNELTPLGRELARLPIDPTLGRMLLQARDENALPEVLIITSGLSVPDVRERPDDNREAADVAHRKFAHPQSDFLSLLNIWNAAPQSEGKSSNNALRRFCKQNFLSFLRMKEWRDIHLQLQDVLPQKNLPQKSSPTPSPSTPPPEDIPYAAIHRSILAGLLSQIAQRSERNLYKATGNRQLTVFPGSHLYDRQSKHHKSSPKSPATPPKNRQPAWIVSGEIVETSQLFARNIAAIEPQWVQELGHHLCQFRYIEPHWSSKASRVLVSERVFLHGLEIGRRHIDHGLVDPVEATDIFVRSALVNADAHIPLPFFEANRKVREKIENTLTKVRSSLALDLDEALHRFYLQRISQVSSLHDLNRLVKERSRAEPNFLFISEEDLLGNASPDYDRSLFPDHVPIGNSVLPLSYAFAPGQDEDGVTVTVPAGIASHLSNAQLQWMVPGLREEQISILLRALPKHLRKMLMPIDPKIPEVAREFAPGKSEFLPALADFLTRKYRIQIRAADWGELNLPDHLRPRVAVVDKQNRPIAVGRDLDSVHGQIDSREPDSQAWAKLSKRWEKTEITRWNFGDLPEEIPFETNGVPTIAYPGLQEEGRSVKILLFRKKEEAARESLKAVQWLAREALTSELAYLRRELKHLTHPISKPAKSGAHSLSAFSQLGKELKTLSQISDETLQKTAYQNLLAHSLMLDPVFPLSEKRFHEFCEHARKGLPALAYELKKRIAQILELRDTTLALPKGHATLREDVERIVPPDFLAKTPYAQLPHLLRYLKAVQARANKAALHPGRDAERAALLRPFQNWEKRVPEEKREEFRWLLEEYRVSVFAQEIGTAQPVSAARLNTVGGFA